MKNRTTLFNLLTLISCVLTVSLCASAQATRTWVSGVGDDANPCSRTAPCKTFAGAISKTAASGEINVLDPGGFGAVTITKAITIDGSGGSIAGVLTSLGGNGIIVNAGVNDVVVLRNLDINGVGTGGDGIRYLAGKSLSVEHCKIYGFAGQGIDVSLSASGALRVSDTTFEKTNDGITMSTTAGVMTASLDRVRMVNLANAGINLLTGVATINDSVLYNIAGFGIAAQGGSVINVNNCVLTNNGTAVAALSAPATVRLNNNSIFNNNVGISAIGTVNSAGNNKNAGNNTPGAPNGAAIPVQ